VILPHQAACIHYNNDEENALKLKFLIYIQAAAILAAATMFSGCKPKAPDTTEHFPEQTPVVVKPVKTASTHQLICVSGTLVADKTAPLSFLVPGRVVKVLVEEGDQVKKGDLLASIEAQDYQNRVDMSEAAMLRAKDAYERYEPLYREGAFTEKNIVELKASLTETKAALNIARKALQDTRLYAPISGIVGSKSVEIGQMASVQTPAFTIVKTDLIYARVAIPESEIDQVSMNKEARVSVSALGNRNFSGKVSMIGAVADEQTRTYAVKIELENPGYILRPGMIVQAEIITDRQVDTVTIPGVAIVRDADNLTYAFVVDKEGKAAHRTRVVPGDVFRDEISITKGLKPDDIVVVSGQNKLFDGTPVSIIKDDEAGEEKQ